MDLQEIFAPLTIFAGQQVAPDFKTVVANGFQPAKGTEIVLPTSLKFVHFKGSGSTNRIVGITFVFSDDSVVSLGWRPAEDMAVAEFKIQPGERFTKFEWIEDTNKLADHPESTWTTGGCRFETQFGRKFEVHPPNPVIKQTRFVPVDVGCGLLLGGQALEGNSMVTNTSLFFLKPVKSLYLKDVEYSTQPSLQNAPIHMVPYLSKHFENTTTHETNWKISETHTDTESFSWTVGLAVGLSMTAGVSASVFDLVEVNEQATWSIDASLSSTSEQSESKEVSWEFSGSQGPNTKTQVVLTYGKGNMDLMFTGTMEITMASGAVWTARVGGKYAQTAVGVGEISATEHALSHHAT